MITRHSRHEIRVTNNGVAVLNHQRRRPRNCHLLDKSACISFSDGLRKVAPKDVQPFVKRSVFAS
jgi:hypothetical protein